MKKLTVVVPCYNVEDYLCRCLDSLVHQDIPESDYEVIAGTMARPTPQARYATATPKNTHK